MGRLINGINGPVVGKVGSVVGSSWKGIPYLKGPYKRRTKTISDDEKANRNKFSMAQFWLKPLLHFVRVGFKGYTPLVEGFVAAKSYLMKNAMEGNGAECTINPALVKLSYGDLPLPENISMQLLENDQLQVTWDAPTSKSPRNKDQVMIVAYNIEMKRAKFITMGQFRLVGSDTLDLNIAVKGAFHIYVAFVAGDRSRQSMSVYLGAIQIL
jgi:hypothetical protein